MKPADKIEKPSVSDHETDTEQSLAQARQKRKMFEKTHSEEISEFRQEMNSLIDNWGKLQQAQMEKLFPIITAVKESNSNIEQSISFLAEQNVEFQKKIESLKVELKKRDEQILILENKLEETERQQKKTTIEIRNVPLKGQESREDLINIVSSLAKNLDTDINKSDIRDIFKTKKNAAKKTIIVELNSTIVRDNILQSAKKFNVRNQNQLSAKHLDLKKEPDVPVFLSESLTLKASRLFFLARDLKKSKNYKYCWTAFGHVYLRKDDTSSVIQITNEAQVQNLFNLA